MAIKLEVVANTPAISFYFGPADASGKLLDASCNPLLPGTLKVTSSPIVIGSCGYINLSPEIRTFLTNGAGDWWPLDYMPIFITSQSTGSSGESDSCSWGQVGDGICQEPCRVPECFGDLGDCAIINNTCTAKCPISWVGDGYCDAADCPSIFTEACNYDNGDCWCAPNCPWPLLVNGVCDNGCDVPECQHDFGDCDCVPGCNRWMLNNTICDPECNNADCSFDAGTCLLFSDEPIPVTDVDYSVYTVSVYTINNTEDGNSDANCPVLVEIPSVATNYDKNFHPVKDAPPDKKYNPKLIALLSSYNQYFGHCYASFGFGGYYATRETLNPHDGDSAILYYGCNADCSDNCTSGGKINFDSNGACIKAGNFNWKMSWTNSATSNIIYFSLILLVLLARFL